MSEEIKKSVGIVKEDDEEIAGNIREYEALYEAQLKVPDVFIISDAELLTLSRYHKDAKYEKLAKKRGMDAEPLVVAGYASVKLIDRQGHLITIEALREAFGKFMKSFRTRNSVVMHTDAQVGWIIPLYINKDGKIYKSGVNKRGLFVVTEVRSDGRVPGKVRKEVEAGNIRSYSIAGIATEKEDVQKPSGGKYLKVTGLELSEISLVSNPANQESHFKLVKADETLEESLGDPLELKSALGFFKNDSIGLSNTMVALVGDITKGKSDKVDVLIRAEEGTWLNHAIRLKLAQGLDPDQKKRLHFISSLDPHKEYIPLYKLDMTPHDKFGMLDTLQDNKIEKQYDQYGAISEPALMDMAELMKHITGETVLELGPGRGNLLNILGNSGYKCCGIDVDGDTGKIAKAMGIRIDSYDLEKGLPYEDNAFDSVVSMHCVEHIGNLDNLLEDSARVAKENVAHIVPLGKRLCDDHKHLWNDIDELKEKYPDWNIEIVSGSDKNVILWRGTKKEHCKSYLTIARDALNDGLLVKKIPTEEVEAPYSGTITKAYIEDSEGVHCLRAKKPIEVTKGETITLRAEDFEEDTDGRG